MLASILGLSLVVFRKVTVLGDTGSQQSALNAASVGIEKTLYYQKQVPVGASRGFCNICNVCNGSDCLNCQLTPLANGGCDVLTCNNCRLTYASAFDGRTVDVNATITPSTIPGQFDLYIASRGAYEKALRVLEFTQTK